MSRPLHEPLTAPVAETLRRASAIAELTRIYARGRDKELFWRGRMLQRLSRECFQRVPPHPTRWWEYPWVYNAVRFNRAGRIPHVIDVAAPGSPLPIAFDRLGLTCGVVDPSLDADRVDYSRWGCRLHRGAADVVRLIPAGSGFITAVAAFQSLDTARRRACMARLTAALEPGGLVALTLALTPGTRLLADGDDVDDFLRGCDGLTLDHQQLAPVSGGGLAVLAVLLRRT